MLAHSLLSVLLAASGSDSLLTPDSLLVELRKGGYTILWRHTLTDRSVQEPMGYTNLPRFQQRNLTDQGVADAKAVGVLFKDRAIPIGEVLSSPMFRTRETAEYAFGRVEATPVLRQLEPSPEQRRLIAAEPAAGTNRVIVTHHFVIERNVPGIQPGQIAEGEAVVVRATGPESVRAVGIFKMADWRRLGPQASGTATAGAGGHGVPFGHGVRLTNPHALPASNAPLVIPAVLETPQHAAVGEYLRTFNAGDTTRMRQFYDRFVVPNASRSIEERMAVYQRLKGHLGGLSIGSVEANEAGRVVVKSQSGSGVPVTITFAVEPQAPYRISTITFQVGGA